MADGSKFKASFKNGLRNGRAVEVDKDGTRFEGTYLNGRRDGEFVEKDANGNVTATGSYINGMRKQN